MVKRDDTELILKELCHLRKLIDKLHSRVIYILLSLIVTIVTMLLDALLKK